MRDREALNRRLGIEAGGYIDHDGKKEPVPAATVEALWRALVPGEGTAQPRRLLAQLDAEQASQALDPVKVATIGDATLRLKLRAPRPGKRLSWEIVAENGDVLTGKMVESESGGALVLPLPAELSAGYHHLTVRWNGRSNGEASTRLILAPARAYLPSDMVGDKRAWGLAAQLYALRSDRNWGIGDFSDLGDLLQRAAGAGAAAVGLNPLNALFSDEPARASPYSPDSRLLLNPLYIDITAVADFAECEDMRALMSERGFADALQQARRVGLVDYAAVSALKRRALSVLHRHFRERHLARAGDGRAAEFRAFQTHGGQALRRFAVFEVLRAHMVAHDPGAQSWRSWAEPYRHPEGRAARRFAEEHAEAIEAVEYQQWQADLQLAGAARAGETAGMPIGIYRDLAVGFAPDGADAWASQDCAALDWSVGAPPDAWNMLGQIWGLPPLNPRRLRAAGYQPLIDVLRANMRHAGALRIDHALGLKRLFWIPGGGRAKDGAYVEYPVEEMLALVALESERNRCLVVGEDLGTVPEGFSEMLQARGILSYRLLYFMRGPKGAFLRPSAWPREALAQVSTHDLPTLTGFWQGRDIDTKSRLSLFRDKAAEEAERRNRPATLKALETALAREDLPIRRDEVPLEPVHRFLARTRSRLAMLQLEDLAGALDQINMPGTIDQHPNWRRKLPRTTAALFADPAFNHLLAAVAAERETPPAGRPRESEHRTLRATYRLQLTSEFGFEAATALLPYLSDLGISHVYLSPILEAQAGSAHGYDGTSYERVNPDLGGAAGFEKFSAAARRLGLGVILDFVPNHMGIGKSRNRWWLDLLEWGPGSEAAEIFDIDWTPPWPELKGKILVPLLADPVAGIAARGELPVRFEREQGRFDIWYFDNRFPLRPQDYGEIIHAGLPELPAGGAEEGEMGALRRLAKDFAQLTGASAATRRRAADLQTALALLAVQSAAVAKLLTEAAGAFAVKPGDAPSLAALERLLARQHYRLDHWRLAATRANHRRFFDIAQLIGLKMERPSVFDRCHGLIGRLVAEGKLDGIRLDHVDGLKDPAAYCRRLRRYVRARRGSRSEFYIVAEKILGPTERLREDWPIEGTTGYDFITLLNGLFTDPAGARPLQRIAESFAGKPLRFASMLAEAKAQVIDSSFAADLDRLAGQFHRLAPRLPVGELRAALRRIAIFFPVYRAYVSTLGASPEDRRLVDQAVAKAASGLRGRRRSVYAFLRRSLKGEADGPRSALIEAVQRFQQFTAPVMAKGLEDTVFYRYPRLISLNEVGGAPECLGMAPAEFHRALAERARHWPRTMLATATHDTKRGEDSRARLNVVSEIPEIWEKRVRRWARLNKGLKTRDGKGVAPSGVDEYFIYQALVGAWPWAPPGARAVIPALDRLEAYLVKALREAKQATSWLDPNADYEQACLAFLEGILDRRRSQAFLDDIRAFTGQIASFGIMNSLAQTALKLTAPGLPDIYQGSELWDLSLVDPDNRRPVDFAARRAALADATAAVELLPPVRREVWERLLARAKDGQVKLHLIAAILALRKRLPALFAQGSYEPVAVSGAAAGHVLAFRRRLGDRAMIVVTGRLFARLQGTAKHADPWRSTALALPSNARGTYDDVLTGARIEAGSRLAVAPLLQPLSVAVLLNGPSSAPDKPARRRGARPG